MRNLILKSSLIGFLIGTVFFAIAPLGLGISVIEVFRPVLIPGVGFMHMIGINTTYIATRLCALLLNGLIYTAVVSIIFVTKSRVARKP